MPYSKAEVARALRDIDRDQRKTYSDEDLDELVRGTPISPVVLKERMAELSRARRERARTWRRRGIAFASFAGAVAVVAVLVLLASACGLEAAREDAQKAERRVAVERFHVSRARSVLQTDPQNLDGLRELVSGLENERAWRGAYRYNARLWNNRSGIGRAATRLFGVSRAPLPEDL